MRYSMTTLGASTLAVLTLLACSDASEQHVAQSTQTDGGGSIPYDASNDGALDDAWTGPHDATSDAMDGTPADVVPDAPKPDPVVSLKLEAEDAQLSGAVVATNASGYSGTGFVDYLNPTGDYVEWSADIPKAASTTCRSPMRSPPEIAL